MAEYTLNMTGEQIDAALVKANQSLSQSEVEVLLDDYPTETELQTLLDDYEPIHETKTVTGTNGEITITEALDTPVIEFSATGLGAPAVFYVPDMSAQEQGQQTWDTPLCLDVPIGIVSGEDPIVLNYGGGIGNNTFTPNVGKETGTTVFYNSRELAKLFQAAMEADANTYNESGSPATTRFEVPLPFSVVDGSTVYCSHLKNQNVAGEEGIWASGNTLYIRVLASRMNKWSGLISIMGQFASNVNYYDPFNPKGVDPVHWLDFFICVTASENYTKVGQASAVKLDNDTYNLFYMKISDYVAVVSGQGEANLTPIPSMSATYYTNTNINKIQQEGIDSIITNRLSETATLGSGAYAISGGAVGKGASATSGFAGGNKASVISGGAVGNGATATRGFAGGEGAKTSEGCAIGKYAICQNNNDEPIDAIQLGSGTNTNPRTLKVYDTELLAWNGFKHYIPSSLLANAAGGVAIGTNTSTLSGAAIGNGATSAFGGAVGNGANTSSGGAVGNNANTLFGGAVGNGAETSDGFAGGNSAKCVNNNQKIDAIQLGTGTNSTASSMQVYNTVLLTPTIVDGQSIRVIPLSLITASYSAASAEDQAAFKKALGLATQQEIEAAFGLPVTLTT